MTRKIRSPVIRRRCMSDPCYAEGVRDGMADAMLMLDHVLAQADRITAREGLERLRELCCVLTDRIQYVHDSYVSPSAATDPRSVRST